MAVHVVQRGNNRQAVFFDDNDYRVYFDWLGDAAASHGCAIHAFVLMTNHIHLLLTPRTPQAVSATLQAVGRRFVPYINGKKEREKGVTGKRGQIPLLALDCWDGDPGISLHAPQAALFPA